jgi:uncharacterized protein YecE (DUF72 family)
MDKEEIQWRIGCSGFHYDDWKEIFYPAGLPKRKWFEFYCQHFNTLELNTTFYRFPQLKFLQNWYQNSPDDFLFSVKVPRLITHYKQFNQTERMLNDFYQSCQLGLINKLGCVLFQLPARLEYSIEKLESIVAQMDKSFTNVIEFRHKSWWKKKVYSLLSENGIVFCSHSYPELPDAVIVNNPVVYYRFHGLPVLYYSQYKRRFLEDITSAIEEARKIKQAFLYFNNTATIAALRNARYVQRLVRQ